MSGHVWLKYSDSFFGKEEFTVQPLTRTGLSMDGSIIRPRGRIKTTQFKVWNGLLIFLSNLKAEGARPESDAVISLGKL